MSISGHPLQFAQNAPEGPDLDPHHFLENFPATTPHDISSHGNKDQTLIVTFAFYPLLSFVFTVTEAHIRSANTVHIGFHQMLK